MKIYQEELSDVQRYLDNNKDVALEEKRPLYSSILHSVRRYKAVDAHTRMIEIGTGTGWFLLLCQLDGLQCKGIEISPQLIQRAKEVGAKYNLVPDIELGNLEETSNTSNSGAKASKKSPKPSNPAACCFSNPPINSVSTRANILPSRSTAFTAGSLIGCVTAGACWCKIPTS